MREVKGKRPVLKDDRRVRIEGGNVSGKRGKGNTEEWETKRS